MAEGDGEEPGWDYGAVPRRQWSWEVEFDERLHCPAEKFVVLTEVGLSYTGDCFHPNWGGGYGIGTQPYAAFLAEGPLPEQMPEELAAQIRALILAHRRPLG